jgi:hypothetical protein
MNIEAGEAGYTAAVKSRADAIDVNDAKTQADNLPFFATWAQADFQLAQAEANLTQIEAMIEQRGAAPPGQGHLR